MEKVPNKVLAGGEEAWGCRSHSLAWWTHPVVCPLLFPPPRPPPLFPVLLLKLHIEGKEVEGQKKSKSATLEPASSRVRGRQGGEDVCVKADLCEFVSPVDTFALCLHSSTKRHLCSALTPFILFCGSSHPLLPTASHLSKFVYRHLCWETYPSHARHATINQWPRWGFAFLGKKKTFSGEHSTAQTTLILVSNLLQNPCPVKDASFLSKILFWWFTG